VTRRKTSVRGINNGRVHRHDEASPVDKVLAAFELFASE